MAKTVFVSVADGYRAAYGLAEFDPGFTARQAILADHKDGAPLSGSAALFQLILTAAHRAMGATGRGSRSAACHLRKIDQGR